MNKRNLNKEKVLATAVIVFILALCVVASLQGVPIVG